MANPFHLHNWGNSVDTFANSVLRQFGLVITVDV